MVNLFDSIDWADIFRVEPGIGLAIISKEGNILYSNGAILALFGVPSRDPQTQSAPRNLGDIFHPDFARERMEWIKQVLEEGRPLRARHIYQGQQIVSTIYPVGESMVQKFRGTVEQPQAAGDEPATEVDSEHPPEGTAAVHYALFISRRDGQEDSSEINTVSSQYIDLGCLSSLSKRELEIFILLGHGNSVPEVARMLHRSPRTVERHKTEIGRKLGYSSLAEIARAVGHVGLTYDHLQLERLKALADPESN
ncbi:LuxR C-terminal-related transcriptional regulator [Novipirellula artificiosorum]|uniref:Bacterial regulatory protein, luxR family n=1 Tax=Novipirellula artificiosorum TaxID=2528016 RepID=A0A5C6DZP0_9BACT|nr:LuxR C-terminal-related transcriptional regulator [Novipirellula artificiosorum]TWU41915.1 Bacterial regulatory protein, luxR family [Novipirellula artificiosorum]